jgi:hypothetical protein
VKTFEQFAAAVGRQDAAILAACAHWHAQYHALPVEGQREMRVRFVIGYLQGNLDIDTDKAVKIVGASRTVRKEAHQKACDRAESQFRYHVINNKAKAPEKNNKAAKTRLPAGSVERIAAAYAGLTKAQIVAAHKRALASLKFE